MAPLPLHPTRPHIFLAPIRARPRYLRHNVSMTKPSPFHPIRAVAIDLDGTLLAPDHSISAENIAAIEAMHAAGVEIILASGRHYLSMLPYTRRIPQVRYNPLP
ncbi:MAG: HAD hydrolase family protein [bacterium]|nr:HAD hydrolase family protein [bacterium]